jgi:peroxiredoxin
VKLSQRHFAHLGLGSAIALIILSFASLLLTPRFQSIVTPAEVGAPAPEFALRDTDGRLVELDALRGRDIVLCFTSSHCPKSAAYNDRIHALARKYAGDDRVSFFAINVDHDATPVEVRVDAKVINRPFPTLLDERGQVAARYVPKCSPEMVVIDSAGMLRYRGPFDDNIAQGHVTQTICADTLRAILSDPTLPLANAR